MSSSPNHSRRTVRKIVGPQSAKSRHWHDVPRPKRDQRPRPVQPRSPQPYPPISEGTVGMPWRETAALRDQLMQPQADPRDEPQMTHAEVAESTAPESTTTQTVNRKRRGNRWLIGAFLTITALGGVAGASTVSLLRIPNLPNCRAIFWPTASASTRLQCADAYADQGSVESLLAAIALVEALPDDHPLRADINEQVELWADQILNLAEQTFHQGDLEEAIAIARKIPTNTTAAEAISDRIATWNTVWDQAESVFREAEGHLKALQFQDAFAAAIQLRSIANDHWSNTRYEELIELITTTREEVNILANAERLGQGGSVEDVIQALKQVAAIGSDSYVYATAQEALKSLSQELLALAEDALARENSNEALNILNQIPPEAKLAEEVADFRTIVDAYKLTWARTTTGYETAIVRLQSIGRDRPLHAKALALQQRWQLEVQAAAQLSWAQAIAQPGSTPDLRAAIASAEQVNPNNPLWDEVQSQVRQWERDIAELEDRPFLDRAELLASRGDRTSLEAAITEARKIQPNSALYDEAQAVITDWRWSVQTEVNSPILAQARRLAAAGDLSQAIAVASEIPANQALYDDAQSAIAEWDTEQQGAAVYQQALDAARPGSVSALVSAINLAQSAPESSADWSLAQQASNDWSQQLLQRAEATAAVGNVAQAMAIAEQIPPRTSAYAAAQLLLRDLQTVSESGVESVRNSDASPEDRNDISAE